MPVAHTGAVIGVVRRQATALRTKGVAMNPSATANSTRISASPQPLSNEELRSIHAYWRAANYLAVGQIYLYANPLLNHCRLGCNCLWARAAAHPACRTPGRRSSRIIPARARHATWQSFERAPKRILQAQSSSTWLPEFLVVPLEPRRPRYS